MPSSGSPPAQGCLPAGKEPLRRLSTRSSSASLDPGAPFDPLLVGRARPRTAFVSARFIPGPGSPASVALPLDFQMGRRAGGGVPATCVGKQHALGPRRRPKPLAAMARSRRRTVYRRAIRTPARGRTGNFTPCGVAPPSRVSIGSAKLIARGYRPAKIPGRAPSPPTVVRSAASPHSPLSGRASPERHQSSFAPLDPARRGRGRIGRRCGCLPGAWVETGHAALPGPGPNRGCNPLPHEPKRRENPLPRPGGSTTRPPWPVDPEPAPPAGSHTARRSVQRGRTPPSRSADRRQATGDRRQATGDRRQATGDRRQATGDRRQATGDRRQATGDRRQATTGPILRPRGASLIRRQLPALPSLLVRHDSGHQRHSAVDRYRERFLTPTPDQSPATLDPREGDRPSGRQRNRPQRGLSS